MIDVDDVIVVRASIKCSSLWGLDALGDSAGPAAKEFAEVWFHRGMIALGCELETHARLCEDVGGVLLDDSLQSHVASALRATLQAVMIADDVTMTYNQLVKSESDSYVERAYELQDTADAERPVAPPPSASRAVPPRDGLSVDNAASLPAVDRKTSLQERLGDFEPTTEQLRAHYGEEHRSHAESIADQELPYGDEGRMDEV